MNRDGVLKGVCGSLGEVLEIPSSSIQARDNIINDLGADSLDLLDLIFRLERVFRIKIKPGEIERRAKEQLGDVPLEVDGVYTPKALEQLRQAMPEVPPEELEGEVFTADLPKRLRVESFVNLVTRLMEEQHG